jgi:HTH-type transcriptional repressor of NAD biosynthesis genes
VLVCLLANSTEPIPVELRHAWLEEILPWATVRSVVADHPIDYGDPLIHDLWAATIRATIERDAVDFLVTSEPAYGDEIARRLRAQHVLLDPDRRTFPVSGSAIRADPRANWQWLDEPVRRWYLSTTIDALAGDDTVKVSTIAHDDDRDAGDDRGDLPG